VTLLELDAAAAISAEDWARGEAMLAAQAELRPKPSQCRCERPLELEVDRCAACGRAIR
jgi:hypothetical protein